MTERFIQSVERAADVLELFIKSNQERSVKEISEEMSLSKSTVHGIIKTLEHRGFLQQNEIDAKYKLGLKLFELGNAVLADLDVRSLARPIMNWLVGELQETIHLVSFDQNEAVYVEKIDGVQALRIYSQIGKRAPLHCSGVGKAILAYQTETEARRLLGQGELRSFTAHTMTTIDQVINHMKDVRNRGYAVDDEEMEIGLRCVAAPIFNHRGEAVAAISCSAPIFRMNGELFERAITHVKQACKEISSGLGYQNKEA
ncbi:IclR family transcriptional regulator [Bacillus sp. JCM 19041]|uniref:IclR family transcriptional regulator n=1 Tax=Bacillus sp. JCM 19041 TaxID=1460637 RepID=UPI0006D18E75